MICLSTSLEFSNYLLVILAISCAFLLIVVTILDWRIYSRLYNYVKGDQVDNRVIDVKDYYDLKYRINLLVSVSALVLAIAGYLGYDLKEFISSKAAEIENYESRITNTEQRLSSLDSLLQQKSMTVGLFDERIQSLRTEVNQINLDNLKSAKTYLIEKIKIKLSASTSDQNIDIVKLLEKNGITVNSNDRVQAIITNSYPTNNLLISKMKEGGQMNISFDQYFFYGMLSEQYTQKLIDEGKYDFTEKYLMEYNKLSKLGDIYFDILVIVTP